MGKLTDTTTSAAPRMTTHSVTPKIPTSEQIRMAQLLDDPKSDDHSIMKDKVHKVMELTRCDENSALIALHDCGNDVEEAVDKLLEGGQIEDEWILQEGKKTKKVHPQPHLEDFPANTGSDIDTKSSGRRPRGAGNWGSGRSTADGPPRLRGRSAYNKENDSRGDFDGGDRFGQARGRGQGGRDFGDRGGRGRGRGRGRGGGFGGASRGDRRQGGFNQNGGGGFAQIDSWNSAPTDSNTWDNSMAETLNSNSGSEWGKRSAGANKKSWENSAVQANDYDWGGEEDLSKLREGLVVESSYAQRVSEKVLNDSASSVATAPANHVPQSADLPRIRGESIDVNSLFAPNEQPAPHNAVFSSTEAWTTSKQVPADLKPELGIGKVVSASLADTVVNSHRAVNVATPARLQAAKVELPLGRAPASVGPIDVQFGDMTLSSETPQSLCDMNIAAGYQPQQNVVVSQRKDVLHESPHYHTSGTIYQRSAASGDHVSGPDLTNAAQNTDKSDKLGYAGAASFGTSQSDQQPVQQHKPQPQQQQQLPLSLQQHQHQQFPGGRVSHPGVGHMGPSLAQKASGSAATSEHQNANLMPSSNAGANSSQHALGMNSVAGQQFSRDESAVSTNVSALNAHSMQGAPKGQMASSNQPMAPFQQTMANMVPYLGMTYDQSALNSFGYLQAQNLLLNASGLDMRTMNPLSGANITVGRDGSDMKGHMMRQENGSTNAAGNLNVPPPGLPAPTVSNAEHAAQLLNLGLLHQLQFLNPAGSPYIQPQFYVPNVSSASAPTAGSQYPRGGGYQNAPALFGTAGYEEIQQLQAQQDYGKPAYGVMPQPSSQGKQMSAGGGPGTGMSLGGSDLNKYGGGMKMYDSKQFTNATATPPPLGNMNFSPAATGPAQYGYPSYLPQVVSMMPAQAMPSNAQLSNDLLNQRAGNQNGKQPGGSNNISKAMSQQYQYGGQWNNN